MKDQIRCSECNLYTVIKDEYGTLLRLGYTGGLKCCYSEIQCIGLEKASKVSKKGAYLRYTVKWADWEETIVPIKIYVFDVTYTAKKGMVRITCKMEYDGKACDRKSAGRDTNLLW